MSVPPEAPSTLTSAPVLPSPNTNTAPAPAADSSASNTLSNSSNSNSSSTSPAVTTSGAVPGDQKTDQKKSAAEKPAAAGSDASANATPQTASDGSTQLSSKTQIPASEGTERKQEPPADLLSGSASADGKPASSGLQGFGVREWHRRSGTMYAYQTDDNAQVQVAPGCTVFVYAIRKDTLVVTAGGSDVTFVEQDSATDSDWRLVIQLSTAGASSSAKYHCYVLNILQASPPVYSVTRHAISEVQAVRENKGRLTEVQHKVAEAAWAQYQAGPAPSPRKVRPREDDSEYEDVGEAGRDGESAAKRRKFEHFEDKDSSARTTRSGFKIQPPPSSGGRGKGRGKGGTSTAGRGKNAGGGNAAQTVVEQPLDDSADQSGPIFTFGGHSLPPRVPFGQLSAQQVNRQPNATPLVTFGTPQAQTHLVQKPPTSSGEFKTTFDAVDLAKLGIPTVEQPSASSSHDQVQQLQLQLQMMQKQLQEMQRSQQTQQQSNGQFNFNPIQPQTLPPIVPQGLTVPTSQFGVQQGSILASLQQSLHQDDARYWRNLWQDQRNREHEVAMVLRQQQINHVNQFPLWLPR